MIQTLRETGGENPSVITGFSQVQNRKRRDDERAPFQRITAIDPSGEMDAAPGSSPANVNRTSRAGVP